MTMAASLLRSMLALGATALLLTALPAPLHAASSAAQPAAAVAVQRDLADFDWVVAHVADNYAGWETKTAGARRADLDRLTAQLRAEVAAGGQGALRPALARWIGWFDDGHLQVNWTNTEGAPQPWRRLERRIDEPAARARLAALGADRAPVEGLWRIGDAYRLAVLRRPDAAGVYEAIVLSSTVPAWSAGEIKAVLTARADGRFDVDYGAADRTLARFTADVRTGDAILQTEGFGAWRRVLDDPAAERALSRRVPPDAFFIERVDARTLLIRAPSFDLSNVAVLEQLLTANAADIASTPQLIIDVRANGGGGDRVWEPLMALLYTRPYYRIGVEVRSSPANIAALRGLLPILRDNAPELEPLLAAQVQRMEAARGGFAPGEPYPFQIVRRDSVAANPVRAAVLIDGAASAAENFLLAARQSRKVTLMGQANSAGVLDFGDMMPAAAPSGRFVLSWPTTRSLRLPHDPVDPDGVPPDVAIPADVADPVAWAAAWLASAAPPAAP
jgi:hypothetical protein